MSRKRDLVKVSIGLVVIALMFYGWRNPQYVVRNKVTGEPIAKAMVTFVPKSMPRDMQVQTEANGTFKLPKSIVEGKYVGEITVYAISKEHKLASCVTVDLGKTPQLELLLEPCGGARGTVQNAEGAPLADKVIAYNVEYLTSDNAVTRSTEGHKVQTNDKGEFVINDLCPHLTYAIGTDRKGSYIPISKISVESGEIKELGKIIENVQ